MDNIEDIERLREEYEASLDDAEARRTEYHRAIKKLHLSGVPLREIAEALGLSHQRVHQIVTGEPVAKRRRRTAAKGALGAIVILAVMSMSTAIGFLLRGESASRAPASNVVAIPRVVGLSVPAAQRLLEGNGVCVSGITASGAGPPRPVITSQWPAPGTHVDKLTTVALQVPGPERTAIVLVPAVLPPGISLFPVPLPGVPFPPQGSSPSLPLERPSSACGSTLRIFGDNVTFTRNEVSATA